MHTTIAIPADVTIQQLANALGAIGLTPTVGRGRILAFDHAKAPQPPACQEPGCDRDALVTDAAANLCAKHWLALKVPA